MIKTVAPFSRTLIAVLALTVAGCASDDDDSLPSSDDANGDTPMSQNEPSSGTSPRGGPILTLDGRDAPLEDVLRAINATAIEDAFAANPPFTGAENGLPPGLTVLSVTDGVTDGVPALPSSPTFDGPGTIRSPDAYRRTDYQCDAGGTVALFGDATLIEAPLRDDVAVYDGCAYEGRVLDGATRTNEVYLRPPYYGISTAGLTVTDADGAERRVDGSRVRGQTDRVTPSEYIALYDIEYRETRGDASLTVGDYDMRLDVAIDDIPAGEYTDALLPDGSIAAFFETTLNVSLDGRFVIEAPWSGGAPATVTVELDGQDAFWRWPGWTPDASNEVHGDLVGIDGSALMFDVEPDERFAWDAGRVTITADDGSTLVIEPVDGADAGLPDGAFRVTAGSESTIVAQDALPIDCAERVRNGCVIGGDN